MAELHQLNNLKTLSDTEKKVFISFCELLKIIPTNIISLEPPDFIYTNNHNRELLELCSYFDSEKDKENEEFVSKIHKEFSDYFKINNKTKPLIGSISLVDNPKIKNNERNILYKELTKIILSHKKISKIWFHSPCESEKEIINTSNKYRKNDEISIRTSLYKWIKYIRLQQHPSVSYFYDLQVSIESEYKTEIIQGIIDKKTKNCKKMNTIYLKKMFQ